MPVDVAIAAVAKVVDDIASPLLQDYENQKYEKAFRERLQSISDALSQGDTDRRANDLSNVAISLCIAAGYPAAGSMGENISVPVAYLNSLLVIAASQERSSAYLAALTRKASS